ncbi:MAG: hypothetical protein KKD18_00105, partial [Nanoarchaeota archaeon]|nr:hypothetical protein [Nanoarchaeota archaeon]
MNNGDKQKKLFELLETPKEDRPKHLKYPSQIKRELGISPIQYDNWEKEFHEQKFRDVQEQLHKLSANLEELEKIALAGDDKKMADLARKKMWVIGMHEGNYKSLESYLKATGEFIEKKEETIKHEFTADERIKIARELYAEIRGGKGKG